MSNKGASVKGDSSLSTSSTPFAISLYSGAGGFDIGVEAAGFETRVATDIDYYSCASLRANRRRGQRDGLHEFLRSAVVLERDIKSLSTSDLLRAGRVTEGEVSLVFGGPPCQSFSVFGQRRGMDDPRGTLLQEFARLVHALKPRAFIFENVPGLLTIKNGQVYKRFVERLSRGGSVTYTVSSHMLEVANYGVPQFRTRLILFGSAEGVAVSRPPATHNIPKPRANGTGTLISINDELPLCPAAGEVLSGLPAPGKDCGIPNHIGRIHSQRIIERYRRLRFGERDPLTRINKLDPERPSFTIIVGSDKGGGKGHVHPFEPREVTARESARIQCFPDHWEFTGTSRHPIRQVGNAVPSLFAAKLAFHLKREVFGIDDEPSHDELVRRLGLTYLIDKAASNGRLRTREVEGRVTAGVATDRSVAL